MYEVLHANTERLRNSTVPFIKRLLNKRELEDTARYAGLLLAPAEGFGLRPRLFLPFGQKRADYAVLAHFWHFLVSSSNLGNFCSNLSDFARSPVVNGIGCSRAVADRI